ETLPTENGSTQTNVVRQPRVGLFQPWTGSMDTGWTRWVLEQYGFMPVAIHPEEIKTSLPRKVDTLIIADDARVPIAGAEPTRRRHTHSGASGVRVSAALRRSAAGRTVRPRRRHARVHQQRRRVRD